MKPDKKIYEILISRYNLNKNETVLFDDTLKNIEVAKGIGIEAIQYRNVSDIVKFLEENGD
jgi:putative hydrolase of the HAD superfamily